MNEKMTLEELKKIQENKEKFYKKLAEDNEFYVAEIKKKDLEITALKMEHEHDVKMINEVKGEAVKLYKEKEIHIGLEQQYKKEYLDTKEENAKKDKIIDLMASFIEVFELDKEISKTFCDGTLKNCKHKEDEGSCKKCIIQYFERKIEEDK